MTISYPVKGTPLTHQLRALQEANLKRGHSYFMDPGAGKTFTCIAEAGLLYEQGKIDGMIICAPNGVHEQWIDEQVPEWCDLPWRGITNRMTPQRWRNNLYASKHLGRPEFGVFALNHDAIRTEAGRKKIAEFKAVFPRVYFVTDESQKMKDHRAQRTKHTIRASAEAEYSRILSGTPILKGLEDLWTQYEIACPGQHITGRQSFFAFRNYYCQLERIFGAGVDPRATKIVGYQNETELMRLTAPYVTRVMSDEFMKGEKPTFTRVPCPMDKAQERAYVSMSKIMLAMINSRQITAQNALVRLQKLMQISSGFVYPDMGDTELADGDADLRYEIMGYNKVRAAGELLEQLEEPVLIWAPYRALQHMLLEELEAQMVKGDLTRRPVKVYEGRDTVQWFKDQPEGIMIANQGSGAGVGQNLQTCSANIYITNTFAAEHRWQSLKRTDRIGQKKQVRVWDLVSPGTVDLKALASLDAKQDISRKNIDGMRKMLL